MTRLDLTGATARRLVTGLVSDHVLDDREAVLERRARVVWSHLTEPGDAVAGALIRELGAHAALDALLSGATAAELGGLGPEELRSALKRWRPRMNPDDIDAGFAVARAAKAQLVTPDDPHWPRGFDDLGPNAPILLWVRGDASLLSRAEPAAALVGARAASAYGEHVAMEIAADIAGEGIPVVSGAAYGIDGAVHRAALAVSGPTIALLAGGVDRPYPVGHSQLIDRMTRSAVVASEVPCGSAPTKWRFLARNRLIAGIAAATVVVEAGWRSGSLNTAGHAAALGRPLGAVPGPVTSAASAGCHRLLREFAATCVTNAADVRDLLGTAVGADAGATDARPRTDERTRVRDALSTRAWRDAHELARRSGMAREEVEAHLGMLHLEGGVERSERGWRLVGAAGR